MKVLLVGGTFDSSDFETHHFHRSCLIRRIEKCRGLVPFLLSIIPCYNNLSVLVLKCSKINS